VNADEVPGSQTSAAARERGFWLILAMLAVLTLLHYLRPQVGSFQRLLERHAVERIIFLLPVAGATFALGQAGG